MTLVRSRIKKIMYIIGLLSSLLIHNNPLLAAEKLTPEQSNLRKIWPYTLAIQAASWGAPLVTMYALRHNLALGPNAKAKPNEIWRMENISTPELSQEAGYVSPNVNTIYGFGFMDLRDEPVILTVPDSKNRYYVIEIVDMWTNAIAYVGGKTTGYKGGKFALVGPGWKGSLPKGVQRINCPTPWVLLQPRVHLYKNGEIDLAGTKQILNQITTVGLSGYTKSAKPKTPIYQYPAVDPINPKLPVSALQYKDPLQFWEVLALAISENPPPKDQITALMPMFKPLGIELGKPWQRSNLSYETLEAMTKASSEIGNMLAVQPVGIFYQGAYLPPASIGNFGNDYLTRAVVARIGLTANTPFEAIYWDYTADNNGNLLTGENKYTMTFRQGIPYYEPGFWSITMYDRNNNYTISNPLNRYMVGSDTKDLKKNPDGSFTLYIQNENPGKDKESNWLPAPPGNFYLIARTYAPKPEVIEVLSDKAIWRIPVVKKVAE